MGMGRVLEKWWVIYQYPEIVGLRWGHGFRVVVMVMVTVELGVAI